MRCPLLILLPFALVAADLAVAQSRAPGRRPPAPEPATPVVIGEAAVRALAARYEEAEGWVVKALVLLSLGNEWHPSGSELVRRGLDDRDLRLRAHALEVLRGASDGTLRAAADAALIEELIDDQLRVRNDYYRGRVLAVLRRIAPDVEDGVDERRGWQRWWRGASEGWTPIPWDPPVVEHGSGGTAAGGLLDRAFDLQQGGLQLAIVIDSTGSMQRVIDLARDTVEQTVALLEDVAPGFELGLVHYRDLGDMAGGAELLVPLTRSVRLVRDRLASLRAHGGGDVPERVEKGLEIALSPQMRWSAKANKIVLIVGDAPLHATALDDAVEQARAAYEKPFDHQRGRGTAPVTGGGRPDVRPFVTSAIAIGPPPMRHFAAIAEAGRGSVARLDLRVAGGREAAADARRRGVVPEVEAAGDQAAPAREIVGHVLALSFGASHQRHVRRLVDIVFAYREAGLFR